MEKILIQPKKSIKLNIKELWDYRELLYFAVWRNIKVRYKQTAIGVSWAMLQPLILMLIFSIVFGRFAKLPSEGIPYPIFTLTAILPWNLFANTFSKAGTSLVLNRQLITKVYFPRIIIPLATVAEGVIDFCIACIILFLTLFFYGIMPKMSMLIFPFFAMLTIILSFGVGLWLSALNVKYRDIKFIIPFLVQIWLYSSPVAYTLSLVPKKWYFIYALNPMVGIIEGFRRAFLGKGINLSTVLPTSITVIVIIFISGLVYFRKVEKNFADII